MPSPREQLDEGVIKVTRIKPGWLLVEIGRTRYTKRFNLRYSEAAQLRDLFEENLR